MKLSVIIPAYNEAATIGDLLDLVLKAGRRQAGDGGAGFDLEILVVDDASTDSTARIVMQKADAAIRLIRHPVNRGKGAAIRTALAAATGDAVIIQDADLEYDPADYQAIIGLMVTTGAPVVYGSRILGNNPQSYARFYWGGRFLSVLFNLLYGTRLTDLTTCYKAFRGAYSSRVTLDRAAMKIDVSHQRGPFKYLNNHWVFLSQADGGCVVDFFIDFEFHNPIIRKLMDLVFTEAVRRMVQAFETRAHAIHQPTRTVGKKAG